MKNKKKALVTGAAGFIGSNLVNLLIEEGWEVDIIDNLSTGKIENVHKKATFYNIDLTQKEFTELSKRIFPETDVVFHLAAWPRVEPSIQNPKEFNEANVSATVAVFEACKNFGVKKVVYSSSSSVYGETKSFPTNELEQTSPMSPYALQKLIGDQYAKLFCELYDMNISCLRYFNVFGNNEPTEGPYVPVMGIWLRQFKNKEALTITGDGEQSRDFVNVLNVARANLACAETDLPGYNVFNVGSGKSYTLNYLANKISKNIEYVAERSEPKYTCANISKIKSKTTYIELPETSVVEYIKNKINLSTTA